MLVVCVIAAFVAGCGGKTPLHGTREPDTGTPDTKWYADRPRAKTFTVSTADELAGLAQIVNGTWGGTPARDNFAGKTVNLAADIDLRRYDNWTPIGGWDIYANTSIPFSGTFDGRGHVISNLTIDRPDAKDQGLFGYIERGKVKNLGLENVNIRGGTSVGALAGVVWFNSSVADCYSTGTVSAVVSHAGGIAGVVIDNSSVTSCYSAAEVTSRDHVGGVAGRIGGNSSVVSCAALNPQVSATGIDPQTGRVVGSIAEARLGPVTLTNNVAWDGMKDSDGSAAWFKKGAGTSNGRDFSSAEINADGTIDGRFKASGSGWTIKDGNLPGFRGRPVEMPEHLR
jgi:hypothetical protein